MPYRSNLKLAFLGAPYLGGVYVVYRSLRRGLAAHDIDVQWVGAGPHAHAIMADPAWSHEHPHGHVVHVPHSDHETGRALCAHIEAAGFDGVFVNVRMRPVEMNVVRYLPRRIRRVMIVHSTQPGTYGPAASLRDYVHATIGVSHRVRDDLVHRLRFDPHRTYAIYTGVDGTEFPDRLERNHGPLRLLYLGRIADREKGVFWLPCIMDHLADVKVHLTIAGEGPDLPELRARCASMNGRVEFAGGVSRERVPEWLSRHDVLLMPSRWEGQGLSLVEAMAAGCVPIVPALAGVTDRVVSHGRDGYLVDVGDCISMAKHVRQLALSDERRRAMSDAARKSARGRFTVERMADAYCGVLSQIASDELNRSAISADAWDYPRSFDSRLRRMVPERVKRWILEHR